MRFETRMYIAKDICIDNDNSMGGNQQDIFGSLVDFGSFNTKKDPSEKHKTEDNSHFNYDLDGFYEGKEEQADAAILVHHNECVQNNKKDKLTIWKQGKENNIRALISTLDIVKPKAIVIPEYKLSSLMSRQNVKRAYRTTISAVHPDKLSSISKSDMILAKGIFCALNNAWSCFKCDQ